MNNNQVHIVLQGRGGVGKSLVATLLCQYCQHHDAPLRAFDTDPVNDTLSQYRALPVKRLELLNADKRIDARRFDELVNALVWEDGIAVIDNGAATFVPLMAYLVENRVFDVLREAKREVYVHCVLAGGQSQDDTVHGLQAILQAFAVPVVVWTNEYFGSVRLDGKPFDHSALYAEHAARIRGVVLLQRANPDTFGEDLHLMLAAKLTFAEALASERFSIMPRQRLSMLREVIFNQLDQLAL